MSAVRKRSVMIRGHRTSFSLEEPFFTELERIAAARKLSMAALVGAIDAERGSATNLSSALRLYVLAWVKREREDGSSGTVIRAEVP